MLCHSLIILLFIKSPSVTSKCCTPVCMAAAAFAAEGGGSVRSGAGRARRLMGSPQPLLEVSTTWERVTHPKKSTHTCGGGVCGQPVWPGRLLLASLTEPPPSPKRSVYSLSYMFVFLRFSTNTPAPSGSYQRRFTRR